MFKIIKTSTYTKLVRENSLFRQENMDIRINLKDALAKLTVMKLEQHHQTAKKLPIEQVTFSNSHTANFTKKLPIKNTAGGEGSFGSTIHVMLPKLPIKKSKNK